MRFKKCCNQKQPVTTNKGMQEIKLNGCEKQKVGKWEKSQAILYGKSIKKPYN